jgi:ERCC4-type nuclease
MILIDSRIGSKELLPYFKPFGVQVELTELEFGDLCWDGNGPSNSSVMIGVERKTIHDLISSMRSKRLSGKQLPGLLRTYDYVYLVVEGITRVGEQGQMEIWLRKGWVPLRVGSYPQRDPTSAPRMGSGTILYTEIDHYLSTLTHLCGVSVISTSNPTQTVAWAVSRYKWWSDKRWEQHHAHKEIYAPPPEQRGRRMFSQVSLVGKMAAQITGVDRKAFDVEKKFKSVREMVNAEVKEWEKIKGVGKKLAESIDRQFGRR